MMIYNLYKLHVEFEWSYSLGFQNNNYSVNSGRKCRYSIFFFNSQCGKKYTYYKWFWNFVRYKCIFLPRHIDFQWCIIYIYIYIHWLGQEKGWFDKLCFFLYLLLFFTEFFTDLNVLCAKEWMAGKATNCQNIHCYYSFFILLCFLFYAIPALFSLLMYTINIL